MSRFYLQLLIILLIVPFNQIKAQTVESASTVETTVYDLSDTKQLLKLSTGMGVLFNYNSLASENDDESLRLSEMFPFFARAEISHPIGSFTASYWRAFVDLSDDYLNKPIRPAQFELGAEIDIKTGMRSTKEFQSLGKNEYFGNYYRVRGVDFDVPEKRFFTLRAGIFDLKNPLKIGEIQNSLGVDNKYYSGKIETQGIYLGIAAKRFIHYEASFARFGSTIQSTHKSYGIDIFFTENEIIGIAPQDYDPVTAETNDFGVRIFWQADVTWHGFLLFFNGEGGLRPGLKNDYYAKMTLGIGLAAGKIRYL